MQHPTAAYLCPPGFEGPKGLAIAREARVLIEAGRLARRRAGDRARRLSVPYAAREVTPLGADPVLLVPGFLAGDYTLRAMSRHLRGLGHRTYAADIRSNAGCVSETADCLERRVESIAIKRGRKVVIVGHSLGGLLARGMAARRPDLVSGIVAMGSPLLAPSAVHRLLLFDVQMLLLLQRVGMANVMGVDCTSGECARLMWDEAQKPVRRGVSFTSIYSKRDGVMDWRACLDTAATHVEVTSSHLGMAIDPLVFDAVTDALADIRAKQLRRQVRAANTAAV